MIIDIIKDNSNKVVINFDKEAIKKKNKYMAQKKTRFKIFYI